MSRDRERIAELLNELGRRLTARGVKADIFIVGGSAMALAYNARRSTSAVDAIVHPSDVVLEEARSLCANRGWALTGRLDPRRLRCCTC